MSWGVDRPKFEIETQLCNIKGQPLRAATIVGDYSIGELIETLPKEMDCELGDLGLSIENNIYEQPNEWMVYYDGRHQTNNIELVDALYDMIIKLKEEGVI